MRIPTRLRLARPRWGAASRSGMKRRTRSAWRAVVSGPGGGGRRDALPIAALVAIMMLTGASGAQAKPVKLVPLSHITNGFQYPESVAVSPNGNIYVADMGNHRVQELTSAGEFVLMFGKEVNETTKGDICTAEEVKKSGVKCKAGVEGPAAGQLNELTSLAVDPPSGDVYVAEGVSGKLSGYRVQKFTAEGQFVLEIGKEVNETTKGNLCTEEEVKKAGVKCTGPAQTVPGGGHGSFEFNFFVGNILAVGPAPEHLLYVGDKQRIQEFDATGEWKREIPLTAISAEPRSKVIGLAVDQTTGDVYLDYNVFVPYGVSSEHEVANIVREFTPSGVEVRSFTIAPRQPGREVLVQGIALDSEGHLAVSAYESNEGGPFGSLYAAGTGELVTRFTMSRTTASTGIAFSGKKELFAVQRENAEVVAYKPVNVAELKPLPVSCVPGVDVATDVTLDCSLKGEVNPWGVPNTEVWFEWGRTVSLGEKTLVQLIKEPSGEVSLPTSAEVASVQPNEPGFFYKLAGFDANSPSSEGEPLSSAVVSFTTPMTAPRIVSAPNAPFVRASSAVLFGELNPENAKTEYFFEYGSPEALALCNHGLRRENGLRATCEGVTSAPTLQSTVYGKIGANQEVTGLQPSRTYDYRLFAESTSHDGKETLTSMEGANPSPISQFTTVAAPKVQAVTGAAGSIATSSAIVSGTVNPDGQAATYEFEVGVYAGTETQYGLAISGPVEAITGPVTEALSLTGLQPGVTYAYRIRIKSGYGTATGETMTFQTIGLPAVLPAPITLQMLSVPPTSFPKPVSPLKPKPKPKPKPRCKQTRHAHNKQTQCIKTRKSAKKNRGK
jgi:NHL repeat